MGVDCSLSAVGWIGALHRPWTMCCLFCATGFRMDCLFRMVLCHWVLYGLFVSYGFVPLGFEWDAEILLFLCSLEVVEEALKCLFNLLIHARSASAAAPDSEMVAVADMARRLLAVETVSPAK